MTTSIKEVEVKSRLMIAALLLSLLACTQKQPDQLTQRQKDQIKNDLKAVVDSMIATALRLDGDAGLQFYWDSPDFLAINPDGSQSDYQAMKRLGIEGVKTIATMTMSASKVDFSVLTKDIAVCTWIGKGEVTFKSGDRMTYDPDALTLLFRNIDGKWKIACSHESATIVKDKVSKK
jgi:ketosteroid isomerase-like protein